MTILKRSLCAAWLLLACLPATAQEEEVSWFRVEVIVFEYTRPVTDGEYWYANPGLPVYRNSIGLLPAAGQTAPEAGVARTPGGSPDPGPRRPPFMELPDSEHNLAPVFRVLELSADYRPLYHASWLQEGREVDGSSFVHFYADHSDTDDSDVDTGQTEPAGGLTDYQPPEPAFDAMLRLRSSLYLHLDVDVAYFPRDPAVLRPVTGQGEGLQSYQRADYVRLQESRRIRLRELHYFDHPLFGVLVNVTRVETDQSEE